MTSDSIVTEAEVPLVVRDRLRVLVVVQDPERFTRLCGLCDEAGFSPDALHVRGAREFQEALRRQPWDMILSAHRLEGYSVEQALRLLSRLDIDVPVIVVDAAVEAPGVSRLLEAGARDVVTTGVGGHLKWVIRREVDDLEHRRAHEHYKRLKEDFEQRLTRLLERPPLADEAGSPAVDHLTPATGAAHSLPQPLMNGAAEAGREQAGAPGAQGGGLEALFARGVEYLSANRYRALVIVDLDQSDALREQLGEGAFEEYLGHLEQLLRDELADEHALSVQDHFAFTVLAGHDEPKGLAGIAERLRRALERHVTQINGQEVRCTASVGLCVFDKGRCSRAELMSLAGGACEKARSRGGNKVSIAGMPVSPGRQQDTSDPWTARLLHALNENRFRLMFQPVVNFHAESAEIYEILLRMVDEHGLEIQPSAFIPMAEERGLMAEVDRWVVRAAAETLVQRRKEGLETRFFVKLSSASLESTLFVPWFKGLLSEARLPGDSFILQLSEQIVAERTDRARTFLKQLTDMQCAVALDHFGGQDDSLNLLRQLPVQYVKIEGRLIQGLCQGTQARDKLKVLVETAHGMGKVAIATFVQDPYTLSILWRCGVQYVQGFYFQPPERAMLYNFSSSSV